MDQLQINGIEYSVNKKENAAFVIGNKSDNQCIHIPSFINYENQDYKVTKICKKAFEWSTSLKTLEFSSDSNLLTIEEDSFINSSIESITIPSSLIELKEKWCYGANKLNNIRIHPNNPHFKLYENKFIIGKSNQNEEKFDVLVFCMRNVETVQIPDFIEIIGSCAFEQCNKIQTVEFSDNSKLQIIQSYAFCDCSIQYIFVPRHLKQICVGAFKSCENLKQIEFPKKLFY